MLCIDRTKQNRNSDQDLEINVIILIIRCFRIFLKYFRIDRNHNSQLNNLNSRRNILQIYLSITRHAIFLID